VTGSARQEGRDVARPVDRARRQVEQHPEVLGRGESAAWTRWLTIWPARSSVVPGSLASTAAET